MSYEPSTSSPARVYFNAGFRPHDGRDHAGRRLALDCSFLWDGIPCRVPAVYVCAGGVVVDVLMRIDLARIGAYAERWTTHGGVRAHMNADERLHMEAENPFADKVALRVIANGKALAVRRRDCTFFNPCPDCAPVSSPEAEALLGFYACDLRFGWLVIRTSFGWVTRKKPALHSLSLTMECLPQFLPGVHFTFQYPGQHFFFTNPVTGTEHRLTILSCTRETGDGGDRMRLGCTLAPELSAREICICDSRSALPSAESFDDVSLLRRDAQEPQYLHEAVSSPCRNSEDVPDWQLFFRSYGAPPISVILMDETRTYGG